MRCLLFRTVIHLEWSFHLVDGSLSLYLLLLLLFRTNEAANRFPLGAVFSMSTTFPETSFLPRRSKTDTKPRHAHFFLLATTSRSYEGRIKQKLITSTE